MVASENRPRPEEETRPKDKGSILGWFWRTILAGLALILPFILIVAIFHYTYQLLNNYLIAPIGKMLVDAGYENEFLNYWAPVISIVAVVLVLFGFGLLFRTRLRSLLDWLMGQVPGVSTIYSALRDTARALQGPPGLESVDTVVLVPFPHENARMAGYLMSRLQQEDSERVLACVYVPIVLFPPSGYTLLVPEDEVVYTDWPTKDVWKLLMSGGVTLPATSPLNQALVRARGMPP